MNLEPRNEISYKPIGVIHTLFKDKKQTPIQPVFSENSPGTIELFPEYTDGLKDIEGFSHIFLLYHFHRADGCTLRLMPFLEDKKRGIFAVRHFNRPNPIGLSLVKLEKVTGNILEVSGIDILDGTPLLDIKPYVPKFDRAADGRGGWVDNPLIDLERGKAGKHR
jgi:tRNA-Thr(GGU) m(6)t(6)A37 methyltransferase TsaA